VGKEFLSAVLVAVYREKKTRRSIEQRYSRHRRELLMASYILVGRKRNHGKKRKGSKEPRATRYHFLSRGNESPDSPST